MEPRVSRTPRDNFSRVNDVLTSLFGGLIVGLADQPAVLHQVVLVPRGQLPLAHDAGEAVQVIDEVLRSPHHLRGRDALLTRRTFSPESPFICWDTRALEALYGELHIFDVYSVSHSLEEVLLAVDVVPPAEALVRQLRVTVAAFQTLAVPVAVQDLEDEAVHDVLAATCAHRDLCRTPGVGGRPKKEKRQSQQVKGEKRSRRGEVILTLMRAAAETIV